MGKSMEFGVGLAHGAWSLRAAVTGVLLVVAGVLVGGVSGLTFGPETGGIAALCVVAPDSTSRIVRVYASEVDLRADHDALLAFWGPGVFLSVYLVGSIVFRVVNHGKKREIRATARVR